MTKVAFRESTPADSPTVLIADEHALVRAGLRSVVAELLHDARILEVGDGEALLRAVRAGPSIRLALVGSRMPGMEAGLRLVELARRHPALPIVVVSAIDSPDAVRRSLNIASVFAVVHRSAGIEHLRRAIEGAVRGTKLGYLQIVHGAAQTSVVLTPRQQEVHRLLRQGMSNKLIASALGISEGTVKNHMTEIFRALNASNRTQAAQLDAGTS